jgi:hypothetical protein
MMETKLPKRRQLTTATEAMERLQGARVVSQEEVDGAVRVKIVLSKKELKHMVASLNQRQSTGNADCQRKVTMNKTNTGEQQFEQMLHVLRKRHMRRVAAATAVKGDQLSEWQPALQSIPEESSNRIEE